MPEPRVFSFKELERWYYSSGSDNYKVPRESAGIFGAILAFGALGPTISGLAFFVYCVYVTVAIQKMQYRTGQGDCDHAIMQ